jgi:MFS family permease
MSWNAIFLSRVHGLSVTEISVALGPFRGVFSPLGVLLGGVLVDRLIRGDLRWKLWLPAISTFLITPFQFIFLLGEPHWVWITGIGLDSLVHFIHVPLVYAVAMQLAGPARRALAISILMLCSMLLGSGLGPLLVGFLSDGVFAAAGKYAVRDSLLVVAVFPAIASMMLVGASFFLQRHDKLRAE